MYLWEKNEYIATHTQKIVYRIVHNIIKKKKSQIGSKPNVQKENRYPWSPIHRMKSNSGIERNALLTYRAARMKHETPHEA